MSIQRSMRFLAALIPALLVFAVRCDAADRKCWRHDGGYFEHVKDNLWVEKTPDGPVHFVEKERNKAFVELYDKSRECTVRLYADHCDVKFGGNGFGKLYDGAWRVEPLEIAGLWDSDWGFVTLITAPVKDKKTLDVTGSYVRERGQTGQIVSGQFEPASGVMEFAYEEPWRGNQTRGTARLTLSLDCRRFKGGYTTANAQNDKDKGELAMTHVRGHDFASRIDSIVADAGIQGETDYAFGWGVTLNRDKSKIVRMGHNGSWGGFHTIVERDVAEDRTLVVLANVDSLDVDLIARVFRALPPKSSP